ncbi:MAG: hypothetical protein HZA24_07025 [Nitrospirae bacterium]|nr:hypothetical protein [Nitrospirota bacterium]
MDIKREQFTSVEAEMARVGELTRWCPPLVPAGAAAFFEGLNNTWLFSPKGGLGHNVVVLPDPSLNLSLPYPVDELRLAYGANRAESDFPSTITESVLERWGLSKDVISRPVTALSGGERMLVSLVKASLLIKESTNFFVVSPYFWLDSSHRRMVQEQLLEAARHGTNTRLFVLEGEDGSECDREPIFFEFRDLDWVLAFDRFSVTFPAVNFPRQTDEKRIEYVLENKVTLRSPTLISGANGVGKSTLAKVLSGLIRVQAPSLRVTVNGFDGKQSARLLMQDCNLQLFGSSPKDYLDRVFRFDRKKRTAATELYETLQGSCASRLASIDPSLHVGNRESPNTVFQAKLALATERLMSNSPLLILDEPGWCLSKVLAQVFVSEVVRCAHERQTAVAMISHQSGWWSGITGDTLQLAVGRDPSEVRVDRKET